MSDPVPAIRTESLTKIYHGRQIALNCVDLEVQPSTILGVLGQNGAGKSTLIKLLIGRHVPTAGRVWILGQPMSPGAGALRRRIGYLCADQQFPRRMTPIGYLDFVGRLCGQVRTVRRARLAALLRAVDLLAAAGEPIDRLSTGMRMRLALAASLINDPEVLVWDEPAQGLDPDARRAILQLMRSLAESKTLVLSSHNLLEVQEVCTRVVLLHEGQVIFNGGLDELQKSMTPGAIELTLAGDKRAMADAARAIGEFEEIELSTLQRNLLRLRFRPGSYSAGVLANVLMTLADRKLETTDLRMSGSQAEQAILRCIQEHKSHGITRAHQPVGR